MIRRTPLLLAVLLALLPCISQAQGNCRAGTVPLAFGSYSPADAAPLDITGAVEVSCRGRPGIFLVTISAGSSGSFASRTMLAGAWLLQYNLYRDSARTLVWGDGTGGSVLNGGVKWGFGREDISLPVYGRIPAGQSVAAGVYVDDVIVTVYF